MSDQQTPEPEWKEAIRQKLVAILDDESLVRVLWYLDEEEKVYSRDMLDDVPPVWRTLKSLLPTENAFNMYAKRIAEDTKRAERDPAFRETLNQIYLEMMDPSDELLDESQQQGFQLIRVLEDGDLTATSGFMGLAHAWGLIPAARQGEILQLIPKLITNRNLLLSIDEVVGLVNDVGGNVVMVGLAGIYLTVQVVQHIRQWRRGEISGVRCAKNIIDSTFTVGAGVGGGVAGAGLGALFLGPIGGLIGGVVGGILTSQAMNVLCDRITQSIFGLPKSVAEENAYAYLGVPMTASNSEVNTAFRRLCLKHHPDKGGQTEDFFVVQLHMAIIKQARKGL